MRLGLRRGDRCDRSKRPAPRAVPALRAGLLLGRDGAGEVRRVHRYVRPRRATRRRVRPRGRRWAALRGVSDGVLQSRRRGARVRRVRCGVRRRHRARRRVHREHGPRLPQLRPRALPGAPQRGALRAVRRALRGRGRAHRGVRVRSRRAVQRVPRRIVQARRERGGFSFMYRYISRESCSQFDSLPLTSLPRLDAARAARRARRRVPSARRSRASAARRRRRRALRAARAPSRASPATASARRAADWPATPVSSRAARARPRQIMCAARAERGTFGTNPSTPERRARRAQARAPRASSSWRGPSAPRRVTGGARRAPPGE